MAWLDALVGGSEAWASELVRREGGGGRGGVTAQRGLRVDVRS